MDQNFKLVTIVSVLLTGEEITLNMPIGDMVLAIERRLGTLVDEQELQSILDNIIVDEQELRFHVNEVIEEEEDYKIN